MNKILLVLAAAVIAFSQAEASKPRPAIELFADKSQDGVINKNELVGFLIAESFAGYDKAKDGLTLKEFVAKGGSKATFLAMSPSGERIWVNTAQRSPAVRKQVEVMFYSLAKGRSAIPMKEFQAVRAAGGGRINFK